MFEKLFEKLKGKSPESIKKTWYVFRMFRNDSISDITEKELETMNPAELYALASNYALKNKPEDKPKIDNYYNNLLKESDSPSIRDSFIHRHIMPYLRK
jgi:hypothetical protein